MSSILSEQNLPTLRRRNIGRRWPSLPCAPAAVFLPRPPPEPRLLPFIACPPHRYRTDRRDRHPAHRADPRPAADPPADRARRGGGATFRCGGGAGGRPPPPPCRPGTTRGVRRR